MGHLERAKEIRQGDGHNCAQTLLVSFADKIGMSEEDAFQLGAHFGGGMRHGGTCGVVSSGMMILGRAGYDEKEAAQLLRRFREEHGALECKTLLTQAKEAGRQRKENCDGLVIEMAQWLEELFAQEPASQE